jgi:hypothetical protein
MRLAVPPSIGRNVDVGVVRGQIDQAALGVKDVVVVDRRQVIDWNRLQLGLGPRLSRQSRPSPLSRSPRPSGAQWVPPGVGWRTPVRPIPHRHRRSRPPQSGRVEPSRHNFQVFGGYWVMAPQGCSNASLPRGAALSSRPHGRWSPWYRCRPTPRRQRELVQTRPASCTRAREGRTTTPPQRIVPSSCANVAAPGTADPGTCSSAARHAHTDDELAAFIRSLATPDVHRPNE